MEGSFCLVLGCVSIDDAPRLKCFLFYFNGPCIGAMRSAKYSLSMEATFFVCVFRRTFIDEVTSVIFGAAEYASV